MRHISNYFARTRTLTRDLALGLVVIVALVLSSVGFFIYTVGEREAENTLRFQSEDTVRDLQSILEPYLQRGDLKGARAVLQAYGSQDRILRVRVIDEDSRVLLSEGDVGSGEIENGLRIAVPLRLADNSDGRVQVLFSREVVRERKERALFTIVVVAGFVLLSLVFSTRILLQRLLQTPLDELRRGVQRISAGNYGRTLPTLRQQDLQRMVRSVNQMARSIQRRDQAIKDYASQLEQSNDQLERKLADLNLARMRVETSEQKYKHLVESSNEVVFSLDVNGVFLTVNQAVSKQLGLRPARIIGTRFEDHLYSFDEKSAFLTRDRFREQMSRLLETRESVSFQTALCTVQDEPRELAVRLEYIPQGESYTIFGKAASVVEDVLVRHLDHEVRRYEIGNYLTVADELASSITAALGKYFDEDTSIGIRIGLREILINAIEHGNLAISFAEKSATIADGSYLNLIKERQRDPRYRERTIGVLYSLRAGRVLFAVRDQGAGFDHRAAFAAGPVSTDMFHGRGLAIARRFFDVVRYNDAGNRVLLIKRIQKNQPRG